MRSFVCKLVNGKGYLEECFYREGESIEEVRESLEMFQWPKGTWQISEVEEED